MIPETRDAHTQPIDLTRRKPDTGPVGPLKRAALSVTPVAQKWRGFMDGNRFDRLTRLLASATSRRTAIKGAFGIAIGGATAGAMVEDGEAIRCRLGGNYCTRNSQCCSGTCRTGSRWPTRLRNRCACNPGQTDCGSSCVTLGTNSNCSRCGNRCAAGQTCLSGTCQNVIPCGSTYCNKSTEICVENSVCCAKGSNSQLCDGACCDGHCCDDVCCDADKKCVGFVCCEETDNDALCNGECCANVCADGVCCIADEIECEGQCWDGKCVEDVQCPSYAVDLLCNGECCHEDGCVAGIGCCDYDDIACTAGTDGCCSGNCEDDSACCTTAGEVACNGECCGNCLVDDAGSRQCCEAGDRVICNGECCDGACVEDLCCEAGEINCNGECCYGTCTDNATCCPPGEEANEDGGCCPTGNTYCNGECCDGSCAPDGVVNGEVCCASGGEFACDGACCRSGEACYEFGAAGEICAWGPACQEDDDCPDGEGFAKCCRGICSTLNDVDNCGGCHVPCGDGEICNYGTCA